MLNSSFRTVLLLPTMLAGLVLAQESGLPSTDVQQAITRTLADNPGLKVEGYQLRAQEGRILQAQVKPPLELGVEIENAFGTDEYELLRGMQTTLSIAWILDHGRTARRGEAARAALDLMQVDMDVQRLDAAAATARLYLDCLALQAEMDLAVAAIAQAESTVEAVSWQVEAGAAPAAELARARAELALRELHREDIEHETEAAYHLLARQWGLARPDFSRVEGDVMDLPQPLPFSELSASVERNPDISRFLSQQRLYEAQQLLAEASRRPDWRISAGLRHIEVTGDQAFVANVNIPLAGDDYNRGRLEEARANLARTEAEARQERIHIETELYVIYLELQHYLEVAAELRNNIIPLHEEALAETEAAFEQGRYSFQELSTVQRELLAAREELVANSIEAHRRQIEIERFTGLTIEANQP